MYVGSSAISVSLSYFKDGFAVTGSHLICKFKLDFESICMSIVTYNTTVHAIVIKYMQVLNKSKLKA